MGKTGSVQWVQVKGVKGQIRLVPRAEGEVKRPGPNQRYKAGISARHVEQQNEDPRGGRGGRRRGGGRGGSSARGRGMGTPTGNPLVRRPMRRAKVSVMGAKQKGR